MNDPAQRKKILLVEDEPLISNLCVRVLAGEGFDVAIAINGRIAEEILDNHHFDLCLIDIRTPLINGKELFQYIRENYPGLVSRVIFTSGDVIGSDTYNFMKETGRPFLLKPFSPEELRTIVNDLLRLVRKS